MREPGIMPGFFIPVLSSLLAIGSLLLTLHARRRLREAEAHAAARQVAEGSARQLGLLAQELQGPGLALLGHAGALQPPQGTAIAAAAWRLLRLADDIAESLAAEARPRSLKPDPVPLAP